MFNEGRNLRAVGYVRVSTEEQAEEGYSLDAQEARIRDYVRSRDWTLAKVYRDEGKSAFSGERRPGYESMVAAMDAYDVIVALKMDRLWRNQRRFLELIEILDAARKDFVSIDESWDTSTPMGAFVRDLFARLAQLESEQTSYRVKQAFKAKFDSDEKAWFTRAPLGYDLINGALIKNEAEAALVRKVFALVREGHAINRVADAMNRAKAHGKQGGKWSMVSVVQIVHNPVYAGYVFYRGILKRNAHEAIVTDEDFNAAQVAVYVRTTTHRRLPLVVGPERIEATRVITSGKGSAAMYTPKVRPPGLDELVQGRDATGAWAEAAVNPPFSPLSEFWHRKVISPRTALS